MADNCPRSVFYKIGGSSADGIHDAFLELNICPQSSVSRVLALFNLTNAEFG
jgi:hypothetical protein